MTVPESIWVALVIFAGVFLVLLSLSFLIRLFSLGIQSFSGRKPRAMTFETTDVIESHPGKKDDYSSGHMVLKDVDEPLAAMIIAIISDESGIPMSELQVKSIKLLRQE